MIYLNPAETASPPVQDNPIILYATLAVAVVVIILGGAEKVLGFFGEWGAKWQERLVRQRTAAKVADDADIEELKRGMDNLQALLRDERNHNNLQRQLISDLYLYILAAQQDPNNLNNPVPDPRDFLVADAQADEKTNEQSR